MGKSLAAMIKRLIKNQLVWLDSLRSRSALTGVEKGTSYGPKNKIAFVSQLQDPKENLVEKYFGKINDEEAMARFGAPDLTEYSFWAWRSCSLANVAMILGGKNLFRGKLYDLVEEGLRQNGYEQKNDAGWKHTFLVSLLKDHGFKAEIKKYLSTEGVLKALKEGRFVIASIASESGSHSILLKGFMIDERSGEIEIIANDPYTLHGNGGEDAKIPVREFRKIFLSKAIAVTL